MRRLLTILAVLVTLSMVSAQTPAPPQAEAPASILAATVADIPKGSKANIHPEGLVIDEAKKVWVNKHQPVGGDPGVTVLHQENGSLEVEISDEKLRWLKVPVTDDMKKMLLPVTKLTLTKPKDAGQPKPVEPKKP